MTRGATCHFRRAMLCIGAAYAVVQYLSVKFVDSVETNKQTSIFSPSGISTSYFSRANRYGNILIGPPS